MAHNDNLEELSPKVQAFYKKIRELFADWELQADIEKAISWSTDVNSLVSRFFAFHDNDLSRFEQAEFLKWFAKKTDINDTQIEWDLIEEYKTSSTYTYTYGQQLKDRITQELNKLSKIELEPENDSDVIYNISLVVASLKHYTKTKLDTANDTISKAESLANAGNYPRAYGALTIATNDLTRIADYALEKLEEIESKLKSLE